MVCPLLDAADIGRRKIVDVELIPTVVGLLEVNGASVELQETVLELLANLAESG